MPFSNNSLPSSGLCLTCAETFFKKLIKFPAMNNCDKKIPEDITKLIQQFGSMLGKYVFAENTKEKDI